MQNKNENNNNNNTDKKSIDFKMELLQLGILNEETFSKLLTSYPDLNFKTIYLKFYSFNYEVFDQYIKKSNQLALAIHKASEDQSFLRAHAEFQQKINRRCRNNNKNFDVNSFKEVINNQLKTSPHSAKELAEVTIKLEKVTTLTWAKQFINILNRILKENQDNLILQKTIKNCLELATQQVTIADSVNLQTAEKELKFRSPVRREKTFPDIRSVVDKIYDEYLEDIKKIIPNYGYMYLDEEQERNKDAWIEYCNKKLQEGITQEEILTAIYNTSEEQVFIKYKVKESDKKNYQHYKYCYVKKPESTNEKLNILRKHDKCRYEFCLKAIQQANPEAFAQYLLSDQFIMTTKTTENNNNNAISLFALVDSAIHRDVISKLTSYLDLQSLCTISRTAKHLNILFTTPLTLHKAVQLLDYVINGSSSKKPLKLIHESFYSECIVLKRVGGKEIRCYEKNPGWSREWKSISPLEYAAWAGDTALMVMMLKVIPESRITEALAQLQNVREKGTENGKYLAPYHSFIQSCEEYNRQAINGWQTKAFLPLEKFCDLPLIALQWLLSKDISIPSQLPSCMRVPDRKFRFGSKPVSLWMAINARNVDERCIEIMNFCTYKERELDKIITDLQLSRSQILNYEI